jgi:hypothetical protein
MAYTGYLGPAGIFSTDDPAADRRQIEAEQYDPTDWEQEGLYHEEDENPYSVAEEYPETMEAYGGSTECTMWFLETIEVGNFDSWVERMKEKHQEKCGCNAAFEFDHS